MIKNVSDFHAMHHVLKDCNANPLKDQPYWDYWGLNGGKSTLLKAILGPYSIIRRNSPD